MDFAWPDGEIDPAEDRNDLPAVVRGDAHLQIVELKQGNVHDALG